MRVLLCGGAGFIGSHSAVEFLNAGYDVTVLDNFINSSPEAIRRVEKITGKQVTLVEGDAADHDTVAKVFADEEIFCVIHYAGLKAVGESVEQPVRYYRNNLDTTLTILECMKEAGVKNIVFSSSATVYGEVNEPPYTEDMPRGACTNPYGWTKSMIEQILEDAAKADPELNVVLLRYFNPVGAHASGLIGEDPKGRPNNLMPLLAQTAVGIREKLTIFGGDWDTPDGTCRRDYIHVTDLAEGHVAAVNYLQDHPGIEIFNLGTGTPYSVLEMVNTYAEVNGITVPYEIGARRAGDLQDVWGDAAKAKEVLGWEAKLGLADMCRDSWNWQSHNPDGYEG